MSFYQLGPVVNVELTFKNGQKTIQTINSASPAILETTLDEYINNDLIASFRVLDSQGKEINLG